MAITWGTTYTDSNYVQYKLGYEATTTTTDTQFTVSINLYVATKYYFYDNTNVTWGYWGESAATPTEGFSGWSSIATNTAVKLSDSNSNVMWGGGTEYNPGYSTDDMYIGTATATFDRGDSDINKVFTATFDGVQNFARWPVVNYSFTVPALPTYTISYNANGGSGAPTSQTKTHGTDITLSSTVPVRTGYTFKNWNTRSDGTGTSYPAGGNYTTNSGNTLYAQWNPITYTIKYNGNGATSGLTADSIHTYDTSKNLTKNSFIRKGYAFTNWNTQLDGSGNYFADEQSVINMTEINNAVINLYAQWKYIYVKINTTYNGKEVVGTLYARNDLGELKPVKEFYQNKDDDFIRIS